MKKHILFLLALSLFASKNNFGTTTNDTKNKLEQIRSTMPEVIQNNLIKFENAFFSVSQNDKKNSTNNWDKYEEHLYLLTDLYWGCVANKDYRKFVNSLRNYTLETVFFLILKGHACNILHFHTLIPFIPLNLNHNCDGCSCGFVRGAVQGPFPKEEIKQIIKNIKKLIDFSSENIDEITNEEKEIATFAFAIRTEFFVILIVETIIKTIFFSLSDKERKYDNLFNDLIIYFLEKEKLLNHYLKDLIGGLTLCFLVNDLYTEGKLSEEEKEEKEKETIERINIINNFACKIEPITKNKAIPELIKNISDAIKLFTQEKNEKKKESLFNNIIYNLNDLRTNIINELKNNTFFFYNVLEKIKCISEEYGY